MHIGMMLHAHTRKRVLTDGLSHLGISISYDRVLHLSAQMGNSVCQQFHREEVVCPSTVHGQVFTTAAVDNIDHISVQLHQRNSSTVLGSLYFSIPLVLAKEWIKALSLLKNLWMQAPSTLLTCHYYTDVPLSPLTSNSQLFLLLDCCH